MTAAAGAGRPPAVDPVGYQQRNPAGRGFCRLLRYRAVAAGYGTRDCTWRGTAGVAPVRSWLRRSVP